MAEAMLACAGCGERRHVSLDRFQQIELYQNQQIRQLCPHCQQMTSWYAVEPDRRSGNDRRCSRHVKMELPIKVRSTAAGNSFTEVTQTVDVARDGCQFVTQRALPEGMQLFLVMPYNGPSDDELPETRAEVIRVEDQGGMNLVAVRFLR